MILDLPELSGRNAHVIRIPDQVNVVISPRVMRLLDTPQMQRLKAVSQLGLVSRVYPGALHSRFEHSLGVYRLACEMLVHLYRIDERFAAEIDASTAKLFLVAALIHDIGHWPYCHPIEDMRLPWVPKHEVFARRILQEPEIAERLRQDWDLAPEDVANFLLPATASPATGGVRAVLQNVLNGPVDIDKMDYLQRDSLHAGVPYGRNFDSSRLIASLCIDWQEHQLAISSKGKTAAEMLVFARYVMFSEVYWHHAVRSATAMLQRLVFETQSSLRGSCDAGDGWSTQTDDDFHRQLLTLASTQSHLGSLAEGLFGARRQLYKRIGQYSFAADPAVHASLARRPFEELLEIAMELSHRIAAECQLPLGPTDVLIDAPPPKLEVQFKLAVGTANTSAFIPLGEISPVVKALATKQFDSFVKQVRVFLAPQWDAAEIDSQFVTKMLLDIADT